MDRVRTEKNLRRTLRRSALAHSTSEMLFLMLVVLQIATDQSAAAHNNNNDGLSRHKNNHWSLKLRKRIRPFRRHQQEIATIVPSRKHGDGSQASEILRLQQEAQLDFDDKPFEPSNHERIPTNRDSSSSTTHLPLWFQTAFGILQKWGKVFASAAQIALIAYLVHAIWAATVEVVEEYRNKEEIYGLDSSGLSREHVLDAICFLEKSSEEETTTTKAPLDRVPRVSNGERRPHITTLQLAQKLALAGVPLRPPGTTATTGQVSKQPSVETLLLSLSRSELSILQQCLWTPPPPPNPVKTSTAKNAWNDIVGLDHIKQGLLSTAKSIAQTSHPVDDSFECLFEHSSAYVGVLLYGPPGCGKSFLIKGLSAEAKLPCLVISPSVLLRKYVGETNQQCRSLFSLAQKLGPCILCIDEVDGLFRERNEWEHEVSRDLKTEFLQYLDGMMGNAVTDAKGRTRRNLVLAATNRPFDVDAAILRRLTQSYYVDLPDFASRSMILRHMLRSVPIDPNLEILLLASQTEGYSPSDLRQLLQAAAATGPLQESMTHPPPLSTQHVLRAMKSVSPAPLSASYRWALAKFVQSQNPKQISTNAQNSFPPETLLDPDTRLPVAVKWETDHGNFYHLGSLVIDPVTFDKLTDLTQSMLELEEDADSDDE